MLALVKKRPAIVGAYALVVLVGCFGFTRVELQTQRLCRESKARWDVHEMVIHTLTDHSAISPDLSQRGQAIIDSFRAQIAEGNRRKDRQRIDMETKLGRRPSC